MINEIIAYTSNYLRDKSINKVCRLYIYSFYKMKSAITQQVRIHGYLSIIIYYLLTKKFTIMFQKIKLLTAKSMVLISSTALLFGACNSDEQNDTKIFPIEENQFAQNDLVLNELAKTLASSLKSVELAEFLKEEAIMQKNGDYDVLFVEVLNKDIQTEMGLRSSFFDQSKTLEVYLEQNYKPTLSTYAVNDFNNLLKDIMKNYPLLSITIPNMDEAKDNWHKVVEGENPFLVTFLPENADDSKEYSLVAYDQEGKEHILNNQVVPSIPVIVIRQNERLKCVPNGEVPPKDCSEYYKTGEYTYYLPNVYLNEETSGEMALTTRSLPTSRGETPIYCDYISQAKFKNNDAIRKYEDWTRGKPEVCVSVVFGMGGLPVKVVEYGDKGWWDGKIRNCNTEIIKWNKTSIGYYIAYRWYEDDGGMTKEISIPFPPITIKGITIPGFSVKIPAHDADDTIGVTFVDYDSSNNRAWNPSGKDDFTFWTVFK